MQGDSSYRNVNRTIWSRDRAEFNQRYYTQVDPRMTPELTPEGTRRQTPEELLHRSTHQKSYDAGIDAGGSSPPTTIRK